MTDSRAVVGEAVPAPRQRARAETTEAIKAAARRQLGTVGASGLSLRAVTRELGMVSSAIYRYFPNRDALLTALLVDAFNSLGAAAEAGAGPSSGPGAGHADPRASWRVCCTAVREWAVQHPHEYALIHGSPVPGYEAPQDTVAPAARVPLAMIRVLRGAAEVGLLAEPHSATAVYGELDEQLRELAAGYAPELSNAVLARAMIAWSQLFGMVSFELFGAFVGSVDPSDAFFAYAVERMADFVGLTA